jgi:hypothetical protein
MTPDRYMAAFPERVGLERAGVRDRA